MINYYWLSCNGSTDIMTRFSWCVYLCMWVCGSMSGWTVAEERRVLPLPVFIHANDVVRWHQFASRESAQSF